MIYTTRIIGDIHGDVKEYAEIVNKVEKSVQVGDFGIGFFKPSLILNDYVNSEKHRFIRGNHDNPRECVNYPHFIEDGTIEGDVMYIGGATSIDKAWRTPEVSWWYDEELSYEELSNLVDKYITFNPRVMITHECPDSIVNYILESRGGERLEDMSRTRMSFERMFYQHQPELWIFGHWHHSFDMMIDGTRFICLNCMEYKDLEI